MIHPGAMRSRHGSRRASIRSDSVRGTGRFPDPVITKLQPSPDLAFWHVTGDATRFWRHGASLLRGRPMTGETGILIQDRFVRDPRMRIVARCATKGAQARRVALR